MKHLYILSAMLGGMAVAQTHVAMDTFSASGNSIEMYVTVSLDDATSTASFEVTSHDTVWFGLALGTNTMGAPGTEAYLIMHNVDGLGSFDPQENNSSGPMNPSPQTGQYQNITLVNATTDSGTGLKTYEYTRPYDTGDPDDYVIAAGGEDIPISFAISTSRIRNYHGNNRGAGTLEFRSLSVEEILQPAMFTVNADLISVENNLPADIYVFDLTGAQVAESRNTEMMLLDQLQTGIYFIRVIQGDRVETQKVLLRN